MTLEGICLHCRTKIQTPDGDVNIEDIQAGDQVYACNVDTGEVGVKEVKQTFVREVNILVHTFVGEEEIITTTNHPFYVVGRGFVKAEDLRIGYTLLQLDGSTEKISRIVVENLGAPVKVYNFEVEDWHTYYVTNAGMLVHNANYKPLEGGSNGVYEKALYHGKNNSGRKNKAPMNGQEALDNSVPIGSNTTRRIGISEGEIVVLDETNPGIFHGHVRSWDELSEAMKAALRKSGKVNKKGKIINDD